MRLTIFEGPDGAGKTTLAKAYAEETGQRYLAMGPFPRVGRDLGRLYAEAIIPECDLDRDNPMGGLVMDRCWISEVPYGRVMRGGRDRLDVRTRLLERLAMRASTVVILMIPEWYVIEERYRNRKREEYVDNTHQLKSIYNYYADTKDLTSLEIVARDQNTSLEDIYMARRWASAAHRWRGTAGNLNAKVLIVGERFTAHRDGDALYQWPFGSFSGSSMWLAGQLELGGVRERDLIWINADQPDEDIISVADRPRAVVALGQVASKRLAGLGIDHAIFEHPQAWKRFHYYEPYPLVPFLKEVIGEEVDAL